MLTTQFLLVNFHFAVSLLAALVTFAVAWLYFDAWVSKKDLKQTTSFFGFLFLSLSFLAQAIVIDQSLFETSLSGSSTAFVLKTFFRFAGYITLIVGQVLIPLQPPPTKEKKRFSAAIIPLLAVPAVEFAPFFLPLLAAITGFLYLRRATTGLERHLKPASLGFFILTLSELFGISVSFRDTQNLTLYNLVAPFSPIWIIERVILVAAIYILGRWVWWYLLKRFETQLFMIFTTSILLIFLVTTVSFSFASFSNIRNAALESLRSDVGVLDYTIDSKKGELLADAQVVAQDSGVITALDRRKRSTLANILATPLLAKKLTALTVVSSDAQVIIRAHDLEHFGDSLSSDPLVQLALQERETTSVDTRDGVLAPIVTVRAAVPIWKSKKVIGAVLINSDIDNAFVDGIKEVTDLDVSVYADNIRSATTFVAPDGKSRFIGIKEENETIKEKVLIQGQTFEGSVNILSVPYLAVFSPLKAFDDNAVGMLFAGRPQTSILQTAARSIELTFSVSAALLILSIFPAYWISKYIASQTT